MVFDIEKIGEEGLRFSFVLKKDELRIDQVDLSINADIAISGSLTRLSEYFYLKGNVRTDVVSSCSRCLDKFSCQIDSGFKSHFIPLVDSYVLPGEVELHASDIDKEFYENKKIDITQSVRDGILLAVPVVCLCMEDCKGICFKCGNNLNRSHCNCVNDTYVDTRLDVLKVIKNKFVEGG